MTKVVVTNLAISSRVDVLLDQLSKKAYLLIDLGQDIQLSSDSWLNTVYISL
jgi:hypothetical protein